MTHFMIIVWKLRCMVSWAHVILICQTFSTCKPNYDGCMCKLILISYFNQSIKIDLLIHKFQQIFIFAKMQFSFMQCCSLNMSAISPTSDQWRNKVWSMVMPKQPVTPIVVPSLLVHSCYIWWSFHSASLILTWSPHFVPLLLCLVVYFAIGIRQTTQIIHHNLVSLSCQVAPYHPLSVIINLHS